MKSSLKKVALAASLFAASQSYAYDLCNGLCGANPINVEPGSTFVIGSIFENVVSPANPNLAGVGTITQISGPSGSTYNFAGLGTSQLNFVFSGYTLDLSVSNSTNGYLTGGTISMYVSPTGTFNPFGAGTQADDIAAASAGILALTLTGHAFAAGHFPANDVGYTLSASGTNLFGVLGGFTQNTGTGLLDVTGGPAGFLFDTNSREDGADFTLNAGVDNSLAANHGWDIGGAANLQTSAILLPEPSTLAIFGLGLLGLGLRSTRQDKSGK